MEGFFPFPERRGQLNPTEPDAKLTQGLNMQVHFVFGGETINRGGHGPTFYLWRNKKGTRINSENADKNL